MGTKPVCADCNRFFRPERNGVAFEEGMPVNLLDHVLRPGCCDRPGDEHVRWGPYKLWIGDRWTCPGCGVRIIVGVPDRPLSEHYREDYARWKERFPPEHTVNDC